MKCRLFAILLLLCSIPVQSFQTSLAYVNTSGIIEGHAKPSLDYYYDDDGKVVQEKDKKLFSDVYVKVNFDTKETSVRATHNQKNGQLKEIHFSGKFNEEGIAYGRPSDGSKEAISGLRCIDSCNKIVIDIGTGADNEKMEEQQFFLDKEDFLTKSFAE